MTYLINTMHGMVRGTRFVHRDTGLTIFESTPDAKLAIHFASRELAVQYMETLCQYRGHYVILTIAEK